MLEEKLEAVFVIATSVTVIITIKSVNHWSLGRWYLIRVLQGMNQSIASCSAMTPVLLMLMFMMVARKLYYPLW